MKIALCFLAITHYMLSFSDAYLSSKYIPSLRFSHSRLTSYYNRRCCPYLPNSSIRSRTNKLFFGGSGNFFRSRSNLTSTRSSSSDGSPSRLKKRFPSSTRKSIKWCVQSVENVLKEEEKDTPQRYGTKDNLKLVEALWLLYKARTHRDVIEAGRIIDGLGIVNRTKYSFAVQERVMKTAAMTGLLNISLKLLYSMIGTNDDKPENPSDLPNSLYIPSYMAYNAVLNTLRKMNKTNQMKKTFEDLVDACQKSSTNLHIVAFNTYLAAMCDDIILSQKKLPSNVNNMLSEMLAMLQAGVAAKTYTVMDGPDTYSFNIVLNAAASMKNNSMVDEVICLMQSQGVLSDIYTYNARLKALQATKINEAKESQIILIIDEILASTNLKPDAHTIELSIGTLAREGRIGDVLSLLDNFNPADKREESVSNAYTTFLLALVKKGEVECARFIFDIYILSQAKPTNEKRFTKQGPSDMQRDITVRPRPSTRHFNCLMEGYSVVKQGKKSFLLNRSPLEHASFLYKTMISMNVLPDAYTFTILVGLQNSSAGITKLWKQATTDLDIKITIPMFNSMMTSYGRVNDPSSACFVLDYMMKMNLLNKSSNSWNVLLSSLSKSSLNAPFEKILSMSSDASSCHQLHNTSLQTKLLPGNKTVSDIVDGLNSIEAAKSIFDVMMSGSDVDPELRLIPSPNAPSYCLIASILSHGVCEIEYAMMIYKDAAQRGINPDGRFLNAILRCYGGDVDGALEFWKTEVRRRAFACDEQRRSASQTKYQMKQNLIVTYHGLFHVAGRGGRADIALQLAYTMNRDGIEPTETAMNCYRAGLKQRSVVSGESGKNIPLMMKQYENLLAIECTKYEINDKRRAKEKRLKIIF